MKIKSTSYSIHLILFDFNALSTMVLSKIT